MAEKCASGNPFMKTMLDVVNFVRLVEKYPCIYNHTLPDYCNRAKTKRAWAHIAKTFDCQEHECKEKWRKIRIAFMRSLKQNLMKDGNSTIRPYYLYDNLTFLIPFIKVNDEPANQASSPTSEDQDDHDHLETDIKNDKAAPDSEDEEFSNQNGDLNEHNGHSIFFKDRHSSYDSEKQIEDRKRRRTENIEDNPRKMFLLSILPDIEAFTDGEMRIFRKGIISCIDNIMDDRKRQI